MSNGITTQNRIDINARETFIELIACVAFIAAAVAVT
jgi:hypothetical protein